MEEVILNLAWVLLAAYMVALWLHWAPTAGNERRMQMIWLAVVLAILLPAISMTDDLVAAQNPAEIDCCVRRGHESPHPVFPAPAALPVPAFTHAAARVLCLLAPGVPDDPAIESSALSPIQNRPPPAS